MLAKESRFIERFKRHAAKAAQVQSRIKKLEKIEKVEPPRRIVEKHFDFRTPPRSGDDVVKIDGVKKAYGARVVHAGLDADWSRRSERWAVMGENGAGKSTLLKMIAGVLAPDAGAATIGASVTMGYFAQHLMEQLDRATARSSRSSQAHAPTANHGTLRSLAGAFGFQRRRRVKPIRVLSGGEKARARAREDPLRRAEPARPRRADQPPRHRDQARAGQARSRDYEGTLVFVSPRPRVPARARQPRARAVAAGPARLRRHLRRVRRVDRPRGAGHEGLTTEARGSDRLGLVNKRQRHWRRRSVKHLLDR